MNKLLLAGFALALSFSVQAGAFSELTTETSKAVFAPPVTVETVAGVGSPVFTAPELNSLTGESSAPLTGHSAESRSVTISGGTGIGINSVPEPTTLALIGFGAAGVCLLRRRK